MSNIPNFVKKANTEPNTKIVYSGTDNGHIIYKTVALSAKKCVGGGTIFICTDSAVIQKLGGLAAMVYLAEHPHLE